MKHKIKQRLKGNYDLLDVTALTDSTLNDSENFEEHFKEKIDLLTSPTTDYKLRGYYEDYLADKERKKQQQKKLYVWILKTTATQQDKKDILDFAMNKMKATTPRPKPKTFLEQLRTEYNKKITQQRLLKKFNHNGIIKI